MGTLVLSAIIYITVASSVAVVDSSPSCAKPTSFPLPTHRSMDGHSHVYEYRFNATQLIHRVTFITTFCQTTRTLLKAPLNITYVDNSDQFHLKKPAMLNVYPTENGNNLDLDFTGNVLTDRLFITTKTDMQCALTLVVGCPMEDMCHDTQCLNGGSCIGQDWCQCPDWFVGQYCETNVSIVPVMLMTFDDIVDNTLFTPSGNFLIGGMVSLESPPVIRRRNHPNTHHQGHHSSGHYCHVSGHDGGHIYANHQSLSPPNSFGVGPHSNGFTHTTSVHFGHDHDHHHTTYLYTTHQNQHDHHGCSLHYHDHHLHMHVNHHDQHHHSNHHHVSVPFNPASHNTITSTFSPHSGSSIFVNGQHLGSSPPPTTQPNAPPQPNNAVLCIGNCIPTNATGNNNYYLTNTSVSPLPAATLAQLNAAIQNIVQNLLTTTTKPSPTTTPTTPTTTPTTTQSTTTTTTTTMPTTTTTARPLVCYDCQNQTTDGQCQKVKTCAAGEVCALFNDASGYTHECLNEKVCTFSRTYTPMNCFECCKTPVCNRKCNTSVGR